MQTEFVNNFAGPYRGISVFGTSFTTNMAGRVASATTFAGQVVDIVNVHYSRMGVVQSFEIVLDGHFGLQIIEIVPVGNGELNPPSQIHLLRPPQ